MVRCLLGLHRQQAEHVDARVRVREDLRVREDVRVRVRVRGSGDVDDGPEPIYGI